MYAFSFAAAVERLDLELTVRPLRCAGHAPHAGKQRPPVPFAAAPQRAWSDRRHVLRRGGAVRVPPGLPPPAPPVQHAPNSTLIIQPPVDLRLGAASAIHYTWGPKLLAPNGSQEWRFEKRDWREQAHVDEASTLGAGGACKCNRC